MKVTQFFIYLVMLVCLATPSATAGQQLFSLILAGLGETIKPGAELRLRVTVKNTSDRPIAFIRSPGSVPDEGFRYEIDVRDEHGQPAPPLATIQELKKKTTATFESRYAEQLKPDQSFVDEITVTKFYDLSRPGTYTVFVAREMPPRQDLGNGKVKSNSVTVIVAK